ncbi:MAG: response regulator [bacterium]|nr:response regulator [bacterium]
MKEENINILLVEDDPGHAKLVRKAFTAYHNHFNLDIVSTLREAREYLSQTLPHLVITDLVLPDGKGAEFLNDDNEKRQYPLVVITGFGDESVAVEMLKAGALDYVVKREASLREMPHIAERVLRRWGDIVERKRAEKALAVSEEKFRSLIENAADLIVILDKDGTFRYLSPSVVEITGFSGDALMGKNVFASLHPDDEKMVDKILTHVRNETGTTLPIPNFRFHHKDERWVNIEGMATNMLDVPGVEGIVLNGRDVTELRGMEDRLKRMQKLESIGLLAGGIAHDYNNILTVILGHISVAKISNDTESCTKSLQEAEKGVFKARELTQQLLTFAEGGAPVKEAASIDELVEEVASFSLRGSNVSLTLDFEENLNAVDVDRGQICQVINNLVINSDQAMPDGGQITIKALNSEMSLGNIYGLAPGKYIKIEIIDQGIGISNRYKEKVFDPYFSTKSQGSGLGLAIVYSIITKHNGYVDLKSTPGKSTTFYFYLPASTTGKIPARHKAHLIKGEGKILVMDDDESILEVACLLLKTLGYESEVASNGEDAVEMIRRQHFDAVIMDLTIPGHMGGKEAAKEIRRFNSNIKLIVSSGYSNAPVMSRYKEFGFNGMLMKPYRLEQLGETMHKTMAKT